MLDDALGRVRRSCAAALLPPHDTVHGIAVDPEGCVRLALEVLSTPLPAGGGPATLPLRFESDAAEANALLTLQLLNIGSGFRKDLHAAVGAGAWETMLRGILSLHLTGTKLDASFMTGFGLSDVPEAFGFETSVEVQVLPAVYEAQPGPLRPLGQHIVRALNEAGAALAARGHADFFSFVKAGAEAERQEAGGSGDPEWRPSAAAFVGRLAAAFPPFRDVHTVARRPADGSHGAAAAPAASSISSSSSSAAAAAAAPASRGSGTLGSGGGSEATAAPSGGAGGGSSHSSSTATIALEEEEEEEVWLLKKAQVAAAQLHRRFGGTLPHLFGFPDVGRLTVMADNVLPAAMRAFGAIALPQGLRDAIDAGTPLDRGRMETALRAAAVVAGERVAREVRSLSAAALRGPAALGAHVTVSGRALTPEEAHRVESLLPPAAGGCGTGGAQQPALAHYAGLTEAELDELLWAKGKEPALRRVERHACRDTYFY